MRIASIESKKQVLAVLAEHGRDGSQLLVSFGVERSFGQSDMFQYSCNKMCEELSF